VFDLDLEQALCGKACEQTVATELILHPDGTQERVGTPPPPLCASCPEHNATKRRIRHVEIRLDRRERFKFGTTEEPTRRTTSHTMRRTEEPEERAPEPQEEVDPGLARALRWQEREDREHAEAQRRARPRSSQSGINPGDFGL
jgi:hypothetical protein